MAKSLQPFANSTPWSLIDILQYKIIFSIARHLKFLYLTPILTIKHGTYYKTTINLIQSPITNRIRTLLNLLKQPSINLITSFSTYISIKSNPDDELQPFMTIMLMMLISCKLGNCSPVSRLRILLVSWDILTTSNP